jgi:hypothetical protein
MNRAVAHLQRTLRHLRRNCFTFLFRLTVRNTSNTLEVGGEDLYPPEARVNQPGDFLIGLKKSLLGGSFFLGPIRRHGVRQRVFIMHHAIRNVECVENCDVEEQIKFVATVDY